MNLTLHLVLCGVLIAIVVALFLYQRWLENHSDHYIHLHSDSCMVQSTGRIACPSTRREGG